MGGEGAVEFGVDDLRDCKDFKIIVGGMVGDIPRSIEYIVRKTLDWIIWMRWMLASLAETHNSTP